MKNGERAGRGRRLAVGAICLALGTLLLWLHAYTYADTYLAEGLRRLTALERDLREGSIAKPEEGDPIARNKFWFSRKGWSLRGSNRRLSQRYPADGADAQQVVAGRHRSHA